MTAEDRQTTAEQTAEGVLDLDRWLAIANSRPVTSSGRGWWAFPTPWKRRFLIPTDPRAWPAAAELMSHTRRGKWFVRALPWLARLKLPAALASPAGDCPLADWLTELLGPGHRNFAVYHGTPSVFTKHTVQCQDDTGKVIAYAKIPVGTHASEAVRDEARALQRLESALPGESFYPRLLGRKNGASLQSGPPPGTSATQASARAAARSAGLLSAAIHREIPWKTSPVRALILESAPLCQNAGLDPYASALRQAAGTLDEEFSILPALRHPFSHGDFLPWNTRENGGLAFAFDWEWADWRLPFHDAYHFLLMPTLGSHAANPEPGPPLLSKLPESAGFRAELEKATGEDAENPVWLLAFLADRLAFYTKHCLAAGLDPSGYSSVRDLHHLLLKTLLAFRAHASQSEIQPVPHPTGDPIR